MSDGVDIDAHIGANGHAQVQHLLSRAQRSLLEVMKLLAEATTISGIKADSSREYRRVGKKPETYMFHGEQLTAKEIALKVGVHTDGIYKHIRDGKVLQEVYGPSGVLLKRKKPEPPAVLIPTPKPAAPKKPKPGGSQAISDASYAASKRAQDKRKLTAPAKVIVQANVKRTIAKPIPDRFAAGPVVPVFGAMKPGEYLPNDSAVGRAYGGKR